MSQHELNRPELLTFSTDEVFSKVSASIKRTNHARLAIQVNITTEDLDGSVKLQADTKKKADSCTQKARFSWRVHING